MSAREHEIFAMLAQGHTGPFIVQATGNTAGNTKAHAARIYQKLGVPNKDEMLELEEDRAAKG